jgi:hypothetical protein
LTNNPLDLYLGYYLIDKLVIQVLAVDQGLAVAFSGVPGGYEVSHDATEGPGGFSSYKHKKGFAWRQTLFVNREVELNKSRTTRRIVTRSQ